MRRIGQCAESRHQIFKVKSARSVISTVPCLQVGHQGESVTEASNGGAQRPHHHQRVCLQRLLGIFLGVALEEELGQRQEALEPHVAALRAAGDSSQQQQQQLQMR